MNKTAIFTFGMIMLMVGHTMAAPSEPLVSPSGRFEVVTDVSGKEAGPTRRYCVKLTIVERASKKESVIQTGASDSQKWAIGWSSNDVAVLYSSDIGTYAYEITDHGLVERLAEGDEREVGRTVYEMKYGKKPNDGQTRADAAFPKDAWREALSRVIIPAIDLRAVTWVDAIGQINKLISEADTNGTAPTIIVDQSPPKVVVTNATGSHALDVYVDQLIARFKQSHASSLNPETRPVTFTASYIPAEKAIRIVTSTAGVVWRDRSGTPVVGFVPDWLLECRAYPWSAAASKTVCEVGSAGIKPGLEGADDLESCFWAGRKPLSYTMMVTPDTNLVLVLATREFQEKFGKIVQELSGSVAESK